MNKTSSFLLIALLATGSSVTKASEEFTALQIGAASCAVGFGFTALTKVRQIYRKSNIALLPDAANEVAVFVNSVLKGKNVTVKMFYDTSVVNNDSFSITLNDGACPFIKSFFSYIAIREQEHAQILQLLTVQKQLRDVLNDATKSDKIKNKAQMKSIDIEQSLEMYKDVLLREYKALNSGKKLLLKAVERSAGVFLIALLGKLGWNKLAEMKVKIELDHARVVQDYY